MDAGSTCRGSYIPDDHYKEFSRPGVGVCHASAQGAASVFAARPDENFTEVSMLVRFALSN